MRRSVPHAVREKCCTRRWAGVQIARPFEQPTKNQVLEMGRYLPLEPGTFACLAPVGGLHCGHCNKCGSGGVVSRKPGSTIRLSMRRRLRMFAVATELTLRHSSGRPFDFCSGGPAGFWRWLVTRFLVPQVANIGSLSALAVHWKNAGCCAAGVAKMGEYWESRKRKVES